MDQIITFLIHHWLLWLAFFIVLLLIIVEESRGALFGVAKISPQETTQLFNHDQALIIDIRDAAAYAEGHILGAKSIPNDTLDNHLPKLEQAKQQLLIIVCATGQASLKVAGKLRKQGFKVNVLAGGLDSWRSAGLPLVKGE